NLRPESLHGSRLEEETVAANIEMETLISHRSGNTADVNRVGFQDNDVHRLFCEEIARRQTCRPGTDDGDFCFHLLLRDPVAPGEIPDVPALYAQPSSAEQRYCRDAECPHKHRQRTKLTQKIQKRQHDQSMHAKFIAEHTFHIHTGHSADRQVIDPDRAEVDASTDWKVGPSSNCWNQFAKRDADQKQSAQSHRHLARFRWIIQSRNKPAIT